MRKILIASACMMALSIGAASAQNQPAPGASSEGNVGPGSTMPRASTGTTGMDNGMNRMDTRPSAGDPSNSGAPTAAGPNSMGSQTEPGAVKNGSNGR